MYSSILLRLSMVICSCYVVTAQFGRPPRGRPIGNPLSKGVGSAKEAANNLLSEDNLSACLVTSFCHANETKVILDGRTKCTSMLDHKLNITFRGWMNLKNLDLSKYSAPFEVENELFCKLNPEERSKVGKVTQIKFIEFIGGNCMRQEPLNRCLLFDKFSACMLELMEGMLVKGQCKMDAVSKAIVTLTENMKYPTLPSRG